MGLQIDWSSIDDLVNSAIRNRTFPGAVLTVANSKSILYQSAYGSFTYNQDMLRSPIVTTDSKFDIASLTKVTGTLAGILSLYESKRLSIDDPVLKYIP